MKVYVMRHGQTDWNVLGKIQGRTDIELNETGINQAKSAKEKFNQAGIEVIFTSPLKRARKTVEIVSEDKKVPIIIKHEISERNFGEIEGLNFVKDGLFERINFWDYQANLEYENMESVEEICQRVWRFLDEIKQQYHDKTVLLVTHGGTARVIQSYFQGKDKHVLLFNAGFGNCDIKEYEY